MAPIALAFGAGVTGLFAWTMLVHARQVPASLGAPRPGQIAPAFTLPDETGQPVSLAQLIGTPGSDGTPGSNGAVLIFYRGDW